MFENKDFEIQVQKAVINYLKYYKKSTLEEIAKGIIVPTHLVLNSLNNLTEANFIIFEEYGYRSLEFTGGSGSAGMMEVGKFWSLNIKDDSNDT